MVVANTDFPVVILSEAGAEGNLVGAVRRCTILLDVETLVIQARFVTRSVKT